ncbi:MAG: hypothetical protein AAF004_08405 [Pseudomonadota bacterium]
MLTKQKVLHLVLTLLKGGDMELLRDGSVFKGESCGANDKEKIQKIGLRIAEFYFSYDYFLSPDFSKTIEGKSEMYRDKKVNIESSALKRQEHNDLFMSAIRELQISNKIYGLLPRSDHEKIKELIGWLNGLRLEKGL